jgi:hypothetical protein
MKIDDNDLEKEKPLRSAIGTEDQLDLYEDRLVLRKRGSINLVKASNKSFKLNDIRQIVIKPAGTLYDGKFEISAINGIKYTINFKSYSQPEFEELKTIVGK